MLFRSTLLGRSLAALGHFPEALDAYNHALTLSPGNLALHAELGEVLVLEAHGTVTPKAEAEFNKAPDDPRSRYYSAEAALQRGDPKAAKAKLQAMLADAPADAPWRQTVADRLAELSQNGGSAPAGVTGPSGSAPGPTARDVAAAQSMTPEQRQAMIRAMVEGLASRLEQHPDDKACWERLARAYDGRCILVTGGASFIGSHLSELLVQSGAKVTVADDFSSGKRGNLDMIAPNITLLEGDLRRPDFAAHAVD